MDLLKTLGGGILGGQLFDHDDDEMNPADAAMPFLNQIPGMEQGYFNPFIQKGNDAYSVMNPKFNAMSNDPVAFLESIMKGYTPSRGYNMKRDAMLKAAGNTAAAGGMRGSIQDISHESGILDMLMGDDMQQWLKNVLGIQGAGLQGESHLYDSGYDASKSIAGDLSNVLGTQAGLAFQGQREENKRNDDRNSGLGKLIGAGAGYYFGGPMGASVGSNIGGSLF